ncbi:MAG: type II toxin-antitoxin system Phd/YefM family antitoxin [Candidatus Omnitrophota bacterium]|jgi:antitoxin YefM|nr:MAG: type II toxin-antitoxin system Phd/YefM family antitoxin [Candidatus Omnitrophota bacterium]
MKESITVQEFKDNFESSLKKVCQDRVPLLVKGENGVNVAILSEADYAELDETVYLLSSPKNAQRLKKALERSKKDRIAFNSVEELENEIGI